MDKSDFELNGFTVETLPSGKLNICNKDPFAHNGVNTICRHGGRYIRTTEYRDINTLLNSIWQLESIEPWRRIIPNENDSHRRTTLNPTTPKSDKTKKTRQDATSTPEVVTNQEVTFGALMEHKRKRKT